MNPQPAPANDDPTPAAKAALALIAPELRAKAKADYLAQNHKGSTFSVGDVDIVISDGPRLVTRTVGEVADDGTPTGHQRDGSYLEVRLKAFRAGKQINRDEHFVFVNPPLMVPDGAGGFVVDAIAAVRSIIVEAVLLHERSQP